MSPTPGIVFPNAGKNLQKEAALQNNKTATEQDVSLRSNETPNATPTPGVSRVTPKNKPPPVEAARRIKTRPETANLHTHPEKGFVDFGQPNPENSITFNDILDWSTIEIKKTSARLGNVERTVQEHHNRISDAEDAIQTANDTIFVNSEKIARIDTNIVDVTNRVIDLAERIDGVDKTQTENLKNASAVTQLKFDDVYERIEAEATHYEHLNAQTKQALGLLANKIQHNETSNGHTSRCGARQKTLPLHIDALKQYGVCFDKKNKYHPYQYIERFENYVKESNLSDAQKCVVFCSAINLPDEWANSQDSTHDFEELKENFLCEYWSTDEQE